METNTAVTVGTLRKNLKGVPDDAEFFLDDKSGATCVGYRWKDGYGMTTLTSHSSLVPRAEVDAMLIYSLRAILAGLRFVAVDILRIAITDNNGKPTIFDRAAFGRIVTALATGIDHSLGGVGFWEKSLRNRFIAGDWGWKLSVEEMEAVKT